MLGAKRNNSQSSISATAAPASDPKTNIGLSPLIHEKITLSIDTDRFVLIAGEDILEIPFANGNIAKKSKHQPSPTARHYDILGVVGFVKLFSGLHLIVITTTKFLGQIKGKDVFIIKKTAILPFEFDRACILMEQQINEFQSYKETEEVIDTTTTFDGEQIEIPRSISPHIQYGSEDGESEVIAEADPNEVSRLASKLFSMPFSGGKRPVNSLFTKMKNSFAFGSKKNSAKEKDLISDPDALLEEAEIESSEGGLSAESNDEHQPKEVSSKSDDNTKLIASSNERQNKEISSLNTTIKNSSPPSDEEKQLKIQTDKDSNSDETKVSAVLNQESQNKEMSSLNNFSMKPSAVSAEEEKQKEESFVNVVNTKPTALSTEITITKETSSVAAGITKKLSVVWDEVVGSRDTVAVQTPLIDDKGIEGRVIREIAALFSSNAFFFSYAYDLTTSLQQNESYLESSKNLPLWEQVDKKFWWNENLSLPLINQKLDAWILPIMQGYVQIETCKIEGKTFDFILVSRRSRERAGLRYQRRGINESGEVANFVETEQIISMPINERIHMVSFLQIRGSIPLFWSQSGNSLKPKPVLERTNSENSEAFQKHFKYLSDKYGSIISINLAELTGPETVVGSAYREAVVNLAEENQQYIEFDFHKECKGMKYENIGKLVKSLDNNFNVIGYFWKDGQEHVNLWQKGIFRTNCIDCLDRTNVVQSAFGRQVLTLQLLRLGVADILDKGISHYQNFETTFNNVWANNGDSISREYAGTSALKGDFTRTGK
ncbi:hypothetical protein G9A89_000091 [Geosiphon pyriformis]|nr:hypothetical protein G9A89_000091 [Geosiphon pyriformis]